MTPKKREIIARLKAERIRTKAEYARVQELATNLRAAVEKHIETLEAPVWRDHERARAKYFIATGEYGDNL